MAAVGGLQIHRYRRWFGKSSEVCAVSDVLEKIALRNVGWKGFSGEPPMAVVVNRPLVPCLLRGGVIRDISGIHDVSYRFQ